VLKYLAVSTAFRFGLAIAKTTPMEDLRALIRRLSPVTTEHELIRLGCDGDGGYLVPNDLHGIDACFSPGVDNRATFEEALLGRGMRCHLADASVERNPIDDHRCTFIQKYLGVVNDETFITADRWIDDYEPGDGDLLLQMDIEGAEWPVLLNIDGRVLARFRIIVLELHDMERVLDRHAFEIIRSTMDRLLERFHVVHIHPNNFGGRVYAREIEIPRSLEVTLLRRDRARLASPATQFPHPLDQANTQNRRDIVLPPAWRGTAQGIE
jgi:hypothetical protein